MLRVTNVRTENAGNGVVTDSRQPRFSFSLASDRQNCRLEKYRITVADGNGLVWDSGEKDDRKQTGILYAGDALKPFTAYYASVLAEDQFGESAKGTASFRTGRLDTPWKAQWITDLTVPVPEKGSPVPLLFRKRFTLRQKPVEAWVNATALGIYELSVNGEKQEDRYFAPGFTSYLHQIQYQTLPLTGLQEGDNEITVRVGGGWAVGAFSFTRTNRTFADTPSLLLELRLSYPDGQTETICSDNSWGVSREGRLHAELRVPVSAECTVCLPGGKTQVVGSGCYSFEEPYTEA